MLQAEVIRRWLYRTLFTILVVLTVAIAVLAREPGFDLRRASVTVLLLFGAGEVAGFDPASLEPTTQALIVFVAYAGAAAMAMLLGSVVDLVFRVRLPMLYERKGRRMKDHVILCGLGHVGYRTLLELEKFKTKVIVIERNESSDFVHYVQEKQIPIVFDDVRNDQALKRAGIAQAKAVIAATNDDLANLEVALDAREFNPNIRVIVRLFDQRLANKVQNAFAIQVALSSSAIAAPHFALAAVDPDIKDTFYVADRLYGCLKIAADGTALLHQSMGEITDRFGVTVLRCERGSDPGWNPPREARVMPSSVLHVVGALEALEKMRKEVRA